MIGIDDNKVPFIQAISGDWSKLGWERKELTEIPFFDLVSQKAVQYINRLEVSSVESMGFVYLPLELYPREGGCCIFS